MSISKSIHASIISLPISQQQFVVDRQTAWTEYYNIFLPGREMWKEYKVIERKKVFDKFNDGNAHIRKIIKFAKHKGENL